MMDRSESIFWIERAPPPPHVCQMSRTALDYSYRQAVRPQMKQFRGFPARYVSLASCSAHRRALRVFGESLQSDFLFFFKHDTSNSS